MLSGQSWSPDIPSHLNNCSHCPHQSCSYLTSAHSHQFPLFSSALHTHNTLFFPRSVASLSKLQCVMLSSPCTLDSAMWNLYLNLPVCLFQFLSEYLYLSLSLYIYIYRHTRSLLQHITSHILLQLPVFGSSPCCASLQS